MKKIIVLLFVFAFSKQAICQGRNINKLTLQTTYTYVEIHKSLRDFIDGVKRENYFNDDYFNAMLKKILADKQFSNKEKVQLFYLMQKKLGYSFVGVNYLPPTQNYFIFHLSKMMVLQKTRESLAAAKINPEIYIQIADSHKTNDPIVAANALLLATLINSDKTITHLRKYSEGQNILNSKNPGIFNHYLCLSVSLAQDSIISKNLRQNLKMFKQEGMLEDVFCALYSRPNPVSSIKQYIFNEQDPANDLAIQTALCVLYTKLSDVAFAQSTKSMAAQAKEPWKATLLNNISAGKIPFNYSMTNAELLVPKPWDFVQISIYNDGTLISNNTLLEFDPN